MEPWYTLDALLIGVVGVKQSFARGGCLGNVVIVSKYLSRRFWLQYVMLAKHLPNVVLNYLGGLAFRPRGFKWEQQPIRVLGLPDITVHHLQREQYHPR